MRGVVLNAQAPVPVFQSFELVGLWLPAPLVGRIRGVAGQLSALVLVRVNASGVVHGFPFSRLSRPAALAAMVRWQGWASEVA